MGRAANALPPDAASGPPSTPHPPRFFGRLVFGAAGWPLWRRVWHGDTVGAAASAAQPPAIVGSSVR
ncbi:Uncharacterised protein [Burkholderia oklahomensis]|nr:hypothetical protein BG90_3918 [Burkholderia oklahomensis C6786]SUY28573.1 Uncharacterised protein [Burkholderia oklahomensis]